MTRDPESLATVAFALGVTPQWLVWGHGPERPLTREALNLARAFDHVPTESPMRHWVYQTMLLAAKDAQYRREHGLPAQDTAPSYTDLTDYVDLDGFHRSANDSHSPNDDD